MKRFNTVSDLTLGLDLIPREVALDVMKRILDWTISGGSFDDYYVQKQLDYASLFIGRK